MRYYQIKIKSVISIDEYARVTQTPIDTINKNKRCIKTNTFVKQGDRLSLFRQYLPQIGKLGGSLHINPV